MIFLSTLISSHVAKLQEEKVTGEIISAPATSAINIEASQEEVEN